MPEPARGYCLTCIDRLAAHMTPMAAAERHAMLMALACCETPEVFEGPSPDDLGRLDTAGLARVIKENAYPYDGDLTLAFCHAVERGLVDDIRDAAMAAINAK